MDRPAGRAAGRRRSQSSRPRERRCAMLASTASSLSCSRTTDAPAARAAASTAAASTTPAPSGRWDRRRRRRRGCRAGARGAAARAGPRATRRGSPRCSRVRVEDEAEPLQVELAGVCEAGVPGAGHVLDDHLDAGLCLKLDQLAERALERATTARSWAVPSGCQSGCATYAARRSRPPPRGAGVLVERLAARRLRRRRRCPCSRRARARCTAARRPAPPGGCAR